MFWNIQSEKHFSQFLGGMTHISTQIIKHKGKERGDWVVGVEGEKNGSKKKKQKRTKNEKESKKEAALSQL